jgi:excisionase family DNA binding protein
MSTVDHPSYMTVDEIARELRVSPLTIRRRIAEGQLPAVQSGGPGSSLRVPRAGLEAWLYSEGDGYVTRG